MRGILLAAGTGSRLWPITRAISKHLVPVFDKPMVYYPLTTLVQGGIREILVITTPWDQRPFQQLLGDGSQWGIQLRYAVQPRPEGIAQALLIGERFLDGGSATLILGDNVFHGAGLERHLRASSGLTGGQVFAYPVPNPSAYGVVDFDRFGQVVSIDEKPVRPRSNYAVPGLYLYDGDVAGIARMLRPSARGELEITAVNDAYRRRGTLTVTPLSRDAIWLDAGTVRDLTRATEYVRMIEERDGHKVGCIEEAAWRAGFIDDTRMRELAAPLRSSGYGNYLLRLADGSAPPTAARSPAKRIHGMSTAQAT